MSQTTLNVDYLVVGAGAVGMACADTILTESDATIAIVDRYAIHDNPAAVEKLMGGH